MNERLTAALADRYRIERNVGEGGMATVYLAHDLRHDRDVAVKVLHPDLGAALGGERFLAEIRTTARLQHPHILPLLDSGDADGLLYYVMPLVTGETLRARLERVKQLPIDDAVTIAREVADALGYAHELGVIHRDIKPENILLQGGHALVADFGIALAVQSAGGQRMTQTGLSLGTPQYMSPEQAMGERTIDARSDIYSLGAVTYEMLIGEAPFTGPTVQVIVARVMSEDPRRLVTQRKAIPDHVEYATLRALEKLPADRWASAHEFAAALQGATGTSTANKSAASRYNRVATTEAGWKKRLRDPIVMALGVFAIAAASLAAYALTTRQTVSNDVVRFSIPAARAGRVDLLGLNKLAISPDGKLLAYLGQAANGKQQLMLRPIDDIVERPLAGTEDGDSPIFSPDGKWIAFIRGNQIYKVSVDGGAPQLLAAAPGTFGGASWSSTGVIVVSGNSALFAIPEGGGAPRQITKTSRGGDELYQDAPLVVDADRSVIYSSWKNAAINVAKLAIVSLDDGKSTVFDVAGTHPLGVIDGVLVYVASSGAVMGVRIDVAKRKLLGAPVQLLSGIFVNSTSGLARGDLSRNGTLFYQSGTQLSQIVEAGKGGVTRTIVAEPREYTFPRLSPDGKQLAVSVGGSDRRDIWLFDMRSETMTRITTEGTTNERPEWTPDSRRVLFRSDRNGRSAIWWRPADMSGDATLLLSGSRLDIFEAVISPDARYVAYQVDTAGADLYYRGLGGDSATRTITANATAVETMPRISPDGRWIAFTTVA